MTTFNDREKGQELKYAKDEELNFKITARRNKLLGLWAAEKMKKNEADAVSYAKDVVAADFEAAGDDDVLSKVAKDLKNAGLSLSAADVRAEMDRLIAVARQQITGE